MMTSSIAINIILPFAMPSACPLGGAFRPRHSESGFAGRRLPISRELTRPPDRC